MRDSRLDDLGINAIRLLAVDTAQQANSGLPGTPMGVGPLACVLWDRFLTHNPNHPPIAGPGPVNPIAGPRLAHAVFPPSPHRVRPVPGGVKAFPTLGQQAAC